MQLKIKGNNLVILISLAISALCTIALLTDAVMSNENISSPILIVGAISGGIAISISLGILIDWVISFIAVVIIRSKTFISNIFKDFGVFLKKQSLSILFGSLFIALVFAGFNFPLIAIAFALIVIAITLIYIAYSKR